MSLSPPPHVVEASEAQQQQQQQHSDETASVSLSPSGRIGGGKGVTMGKKGKSKK